MEIYAIQDESRPGAPGIGYLFSFPLLQEFRIELRKEIDEWDAPLLLDHFVGPGQRSMDARVSRTWVQQRIVPPERQNVGQILASHGLDFYDEAALLRLPKRCCAQDDFALAHVPGDSPGDSFPEEISDRLYYKVEEVIPEVPFQLLLFFRDGSVKRWDAVEQCRDRAEFAPLLSSQAVFDGVELQPLGYGVRWEGMQSVSDLDLYRQSVPAVPTAQDMERFRTLRTADSEEAARILFCLTDQAVELSLPPLPGTEADPRYRKRDVVRALW